jgi:hypothetical protein
MTSRLSALGYLALMTLVVYGAMNREDQSSGGWLLVVLVVVQLAAGFLVGRWWAILLPLLVVVISVPAGHPPITTEEPFPIWFVLSFLSLFAIPLVGLGVVSRRTLRRI